MPRTNAPAPSRTERWSLPPLREARYSASLERGLAILRCFTPATPVLGISDIADRLEMSRSTTHRYVITLLALEYLEQGASRKYRLGLRVTDLGMSALNSTSLGEHAQPYLEELCSRTSFTTSVSVLEGDSVVIVDRVRSFHRGGAIVDSLDLMAGSRIPLHCTASGKILLAALGTAASKQILGSEKLAKHGPNTIVSKKKLHEELEGVASEDFAIDCEEFAHGHQSIAASVRDASRRVVAAVEVTTPVALIGLGVLADSIGPHLVSTADRLSARLGYRRDDEQAGATALAA